MPFCLILLKKGIPFNGAGTKCTVFNASSGEVLGTIALGGKPEFATADGKGKVYVNIEDKNEVARNRQHKTHGP